MYRRLILTAACITALVFSAAAAPRTDAPELTLYSGRSESLVDPLVRMFEEESGIRVRVRYGGTSELAVLLAEEGTRTPADLFWAQDAGGLGALSQSGLLKNLPDSLYTGIPDVFHSESGTWVPTSGRARLFAYSPQRTAGESLPQSVFSLTETRYRGRVGWAPTNGSFQAFVTAMRITYGNERTYDWLRAMIDNNVQSYRNNTALVEAVAAGELDYALVNYYYLYRFTSVDPDFPAAQQFFALGDIGNMINTAGVGILASSSSPEAALQFVEFLLRPDIQQYAADQLNEYPVRDSPSIEELIAVSPRIPLDSLADLQNTLELLRAAGAL